MLDIAVNVRMPEIGTTSAREANEAAARGISNLVIRHLRERNGRTAPNRHGLPKSNYYAEAAESITTEVSEAEAVVQIRQPGVGLHWKGGEVRPRPGKKALAIPVDARVATIWPSEAQGSSGGSEYALIWPKGSDHGWIKDAESGDLLWLLVPHVRIPADSDVLPGIEEMGEAAARAVQEMLS